MPAISPVPSFVTETHRFHASTGAGLDGEIITAGAHRLGAQPGMPGPSEAQGGPSTPGAGTSSTMQSRLMAQARQRSRAPAMEAGGVASGSGLGGGAGVRHVPQGFVILLEATEPAHLDLPQGAHLAVDGALADYHAAFAGHASYPSASARQQMFGAARQRMHAHAAGHGGVEDRPHETTAPAAAHLAAAMMLHAAGEMVRTLLDTGEAYLHAARQHPHHPIGLLAQAVGAALEASAYAMLPAVQHAYAHAPAEVIAAHDMLEPDEEPMQAMHDERHALSARADERTPAPAAHDDSGLDPHVLAQVRELHEQEQDPAFWSAFSYLLQFAQDAQAH